ncbi:BatA domain-containing protein [Schleiferiaceae bacterium]|nr:BatA domain-containing protein [Schleiferiaceae bacterium]
MVFDSPQWLWATALAFIVPIIHLMGRRAIQPVSIPSLMWLDQFKTQDRRRNKLKEWLLILLRMLVISLFFFSLAGPRITSKSTILVVDNAPVFWSLKKSWLPMALQGLPQEIYTLRVRGGISLGTFRFDELEEALEDWPASSAPLQDIEGATLISAGFTSLPAGASHYYLPKRKSLFNSSIALVSENMREQTFTVINGPHKGVWELRDSSKLILQLIQI